MPSYCWMRRIYSTHSNVDYTHTKYKSSQGVLIFSIQWQEEQANKLLNKFENRTYIQICIALNHRSSEGCLLCKTHSDLYEIQRKVLVFNMRGFGMDLYFAVWILKPVVYFRLHYKNTMNKMFCLLYNSKLFITLAYPSNTCQMRTYKLTKKKFRKSCTHLLNTDIFV